MNTVSRSPAVRAARASKPAVALAIMLGAQLMIILDATVVNIALPHIQAGLGFSATSLSIAYSGWRGRHPLDVDVAYGVTVSRTASE